MAVFSSLALILVSCPYLFAVDGLARSEWEGEKRKDDQK